MSVVIMEGQLLGLINRDPVLKARGCTAVRQPGGGLAVVRNGHHRGLWAWQGNGFSYTSGGYASPNVLVETPAEAVIFTRDIACPGNL